MITRKLESKKFMQAIVWRIEHEIAYIMIDFNLLKIDHSTLELMMKV